MAYETLELVQEGALAWLTLHRPGRLNALRFGSATP
jgi:enoyl-CoA hydratase/carnithine racemase